MRMRHWGSRIGDTCWRMGGLRWRGRRVSCWSIRRCRRLISAGMAGITRSRHGYERRRWSCWGVRYAVVNDGLQSFTCIAQTEDLINDARERCGGVDDDGVFRNVLLRLMQSHSEFSFPWFSTEVSWVQCHSLINPPVHRVHVDVQDKRAVK